MSQRFCHNNRKTGTDLSGRFHRHTRGWKYNKRLICNADVDYLVQTKINDAKMQVCDAIQSVSGVLAQLKTKAV